MNSKLRLAATTLAALSIIFALFTRPSEPVSLDRLHSAGIILIPRAIGPESITFDPTGKGPYTGVADGRILKWQGHGLGWIDFAITTSQRKGCVQPYDLEMEPVCGRPLGLRFDKKTGDLYIADAYFGLQVVGPGGGLATPLVTEVEGRRLLFINDLDIDDHEDVIYFTDTSTVYQRREFEKAFLSGDATGRLIKYDKSSKEVTILLRGLAFANGVALSKDGSFVLVAETARCRIPRLWLHGPNAGNVHVFVELPGAPDNVRRNSEGEFWVALQPKIRLSPRWVTSNSWFGKILLKLHALFWGGEAYATAIKISEEGKVLEGLKDSDGKVLRFINELDEKDGKLWIGSLTMPFVGIYNLF